MCSTVLVGKQTKYCKPGCKITDWRRRVKLRAVEYKGGECEECGYDRSPIAMIFHHPGGKSFGISNGGATRSWVRIKKELDKCRLLCLNCHAEEHTAGGSTARAPA